MSDCVICHEPIASTDGLRWVHTHGDVYCGTGDGATAMPPGSPCPNCGSRWNMTRAGWRAIYGCFACLHHWWNLRKRVTQ